MATAFTSRTSDNRMEVNFHEGQVQVWNSTARTVLLLAGAQSGKALALDTPIPTPNGFVKMVDLQVGDDVFDERGKPCKVTFCSPVYIGNKCYRVCFDDGTSVIADGNHQWLTKNQKLREGDFYGKRKPIPDCLVVSTEEMINTIRYKGRCQYSIDLCKPLEMEKTDLPIPPYTLGVWLGDGSASGTHLTNADKQVLEEVSKDGFAISRNGEYRNKDDIGFTFRYKDVPVGFRSGEKLRNKHKSEKWGAIEKLYSEECELAKLGKVSVPNIYGNRKRPSHFPPLTAREFCTMHGINFDRFVGNKRLARMRRLYEKDGMIVNSDCSIVKAGAKQLMDVFREMNLVKNKHIPLQYLLASREDRLALLQGLMDTDGWCRKQCHFGNTNKKIAYGALWLARSLGFKARIRYKRSFLYGKECAPGWRVSFTTKTPVFRLKRKLDRQQRNPRSDTRRRYITSIEPVNSVAVKCIQVNSKSHLYLCGKSCIPTHNTSIGPFWLHREIQTRGPGDYLVVAPTFPLLSMKVLPEFLKLFKTQLKLGTFTGNPIRRFILTNYGQKCMWGKTFDEPTQVFFGHASDPDSLESATVKAAWCDEAGQKVFKLGSYEAISRRLAVNQGRCLLTTTPYCFNWLKQQIYDPWKLKKFKPHEVDVINFDSLMNPAFPRDEYERAKKSMPEWKFNMMYRGMFERPAGVVYDCFDPKIHKVPRFHIPDNWPRYMGLDFGGMNTAAVFLAGEVNSEGKEVGRYFLYREYWPRQGRTAKEHTYYLLNGENGMPIAVGGSHSEDQWRKEFRSGGEVDVRLSNGGKERRKIPSLYVREPPIKEVDVGIQLVYGMIKKNELLVFDDCKYVLDELESYSYKLDDTGEPTDEIEDKSMYHTLDSLRYICAYLRKPKRVFEIY